MASNFAFQPYGLSQTVTFGGATPATVSLTVRRIGTTATLALTGGNYTPKALRFSLAATANAFIQFSDTAANMTVSPTVGMQMLANTVEIFSTGGNPFVGFACGGTDTVTISFTPGEGL